MSDTVKLRYRSNAVALSRSAEQCRVTLEGVQAKGRSASTEVAYSAVAQPYVAQSTATGLPASRAGQLGPCPLPEAEGARKTEPAVPTVVLVCSPAQAVGSTLPLTQPRVGDATDTGEISDFDIEQMKRDARVMIHALHARGGPISAMDDRSVSDPRATDPFAAAKSAADAALAAGGSQHTQNAGVG